MELPYPDHPQRFSHWNQVLCQEGLTGRCYWEVDWEGWVNIGVAYKRIKRKGRDDSWIGQNDASWSLVCHDKFSASHKHQRIVIPMQPSAGTSRVAVYLDWPAGTLTFYRVSSDKLISLHTFHSTFTEPLYPAFGFELSSGSSVALRHMWGFKWKRMETLLTVSWMSNDRAPTCTYGEVKWLNIFF